MLRHPKYTRDRLAKTARRMREMVYRDVDPVESLRISPRVDRISWEEAQQLPYEDVSLGQPLGPTWSTFWVKAHTTVPDAWDGERVDLLWVSHSEATLWVDGRSVQGLNFGSRGERIDAVLAPTAQGGGELSFQVEVACNGMFGTLDHPILPPERRYWSIEPVVLDRCDIALFDQEAWDLFFDFDVLRQLEAEPANDLDRPLAGRLLYELNRVCNTWQRDDRSTWPEARSIIAELYANHNGDYAHEIAAVGHGHIDTAWLWPLAESYRKCVRTFSSQTTYMDAYPEFKFACSQAQQYKWIKERNPDLYTRIKDRIERGQFVPVGGTWIEPDCNIPSGESLVRQFLLGQTFFEREFGVRCREFWNPDVFGYNGQLPQIMQGAGIGWFLTQKLSWNAFNKPQYHTFLWEGIDGSRVLTHFPPADNYHSEADVAELRRSVRDYKDHDRSRTSYLLFGHGDGGGGPTKEMLERLRRVRDLQGIPCTTQRSSEEFFTALEQEAADLPVLVGELYFEYHRGTYTSEAFVKRANRKCEILLRDVELLAATAHWRDLQPYPRDELARLWQLLCLNQFHDIIPGSSIREVYEDAARDYDEIEKSGRNLLSLTLSALAEGATDARPLNTLGRSRHAVVASPEGDLGFVAAGPFSTAVQAEPQSPVSVNAHPEGWVLENQHLLVMVRRDGAVASLVHRATQRETLADAGNVLELYEDVPVAFEAWDVDPFHLETRRDCPGAGDGRVLLESSVRVELVFEHALGTSSTGTQIIRLDADSRRLEFEWVVDWHESQKLLKVRFPVNVRSQDATYEMQFGVAERPTHYSTSYDLARYEVPGHKWADLSEHGFGVALLTESKYGYSTFENTMRVSLLRAPKHPDSESDMGHHRFQYAVYPHAKGWQDGDVVAEALDFNVPLVWSAATLETLFELDTPDLVLDTIKLAEESDAIVLRLYEAHGGRGKAHLRTSLEIAEARRANLLEEEQGPDLPINESGIELDYRPFEIITIVVRREPKRLD